MLWPARGTARHETASWGIRAKVGKDLAIFRVKLPGQIAYGNALRSQLAKRANRLALRGHRVGACALEGERKRFRVVGKATRPKTFSLVNWKIALAFEQGQARPPVHESGHSFAPRARPTRSCARAALHAQRCRQARGPRFQARGRRREQQRTSAPHRQPKSLPYPADRPQPRPGGQIGHMEQRLRSF